MKTFVFELQEKSRWPFTGKVESTTKEKFGILLTYNVYRSYRINLFGMKLFAYNKYLGDKTFYRPLKKDWDKHAYRVPPVYWGKKTTKLTRLWVILHSITIKDNCVHVITEESLINHKVKLFEESFISHDLTEHLFKSKKRFTINNVI